MPSSLQRKRIFWSVVLFALSMMLTLIPAERFMSNLESALSSKEMIPSKAVQSITNNGADNLSDIKPLYGFIENKGQIRDQDNKSNAKVKYLLPLPNNNVVLKATGFSYDTYIMEVEDEDTLHKQPVRMQYRPKKSTYKFHRVDVEFEGANANAEIVTGTRSLDYIHYPPEDAKDEIKVFHYDKITYKNIYPNIDLEFLARPGKNKPVEYNFIVHPGGDINQIQMRYSGASSNKLANQKIILGLAHGKLIECIPASYLQQSGTPVDIRYKHIATGPDHMVLSFTGMDPPLAESLVIDPTPVLDWATNYGGSVSDYSRGVSADNAGNVYIIGYTVSSNAIATSGSHQSTYTGNVEVFLVKFNSSGVRQWGTYYGGANDDFAGDIGCDPSGNVYITGQTKSTTGIASAGAHQTALAGGTSVADIFIAKFNTNGVRQWGTYMGGSFDDAGFGLTVDGSGNVFVSGMAASESGVATGGPVPLPGWSQGFVAKFNTSGVRQWSTYYGDPDNLDQGGVVEVDGAGNIYMVGTTWSSSDIATAGAYQTSPSGGGDTFVAKFNSSGTPVWGTYFGGPGFENVLGVATDLSGNVYLSGYTNSTSGITTSGSHQASHGGGDMDGFLAKFSTSGAIQWSTYYGGSDYDISANVTFDGSSYIYITGFTNSMNGIATPGTFQPVGSTSSGGYFAKFNLNGVREWGTYHPNVTPSEIDIDGSGNIYVTGSTGSSIGTPGSHQPSIGGGEDAYLSRFSCATPVVGSIGNDQTICTGNVPGSLVNSSSGSGGNYQWQQSLNNATWTDISGANAATYSPGSLTVTTYYRRNLIGCPSTISSNVVTVTVLPSPVAGAIGSSQTICSGATPSTLANVTAGANGTYQWQSSLNNSTWSNISGATAEAYAPPALTSTTYYRRNIVSANCGTVSTSAVTITVTPLPTSGAIGGAQTACVNTVPATLTNVTSGANGTYQWQSSNDNSTWSNISGATSATYTPPAILNATYYRRNVVSASCGTVSTASVFVNIAFHPSAGLIGASNTICSGTAPGTLTNAGAGANGTYQWQSSSDNSIWTNITGATSGTYSPPALTTTTYFRRSVVSQACGTTASTASVTITVVPQPTAGEIGGDVTVCSGTPVTLTNVVSATGGTYQWQHVISSIWTDIPGATGATYTLGGPTLTNQYRRKVVPSMMCVGVGTISTAPVTVTVINSPVAGAIGGASTICAGTSASLTNTTSGGNGTYQWQSSPDNSTWTNISGATSATYTTPSLSTTTYYRRNVVTASCGTVSTSSVTITVLPLPTAGTIGGAQSICSGATPTALTNTAAGANGTYQWQSSPNSTTWTDISGATAATYAPPALTATTHYRRNVISASCGTVSTSAVTITISPLPSAGSIGGAQTICSGTVPSALTNVTSGVGSYQWQSSPNGTTWTDISGATAATYAPPALTVTTHYRRNAVSCSTIASTNAIIVTVSPLPLAGSIGGAQTICSGTVPSALTNAASGVGSYQWQSSPDGTTWSNISGATAATYAPPILTATTHYRRNATSCSATVNSNVIVKTVTQPQKADFTYGGSPYCPWHSAVNPPANPVVTFINGGAAGAFSATPSGLSMSAVTGAIDLKLSASGTYTVTNFIAANGGCPAVTATATVTIHPRTEFTINEIEENGIRNYYIEQAASDPGWADAHLYNWWYINVKPRRVNATDENYPWMTVGMFQPLSFVLDIVTDESLIIDVKENSTGCITRMELGRDVLDGTIPTVWPN